MGMYNEVFKTCPKCKGSANAQIPQVVLGFGGFNLDDPQSIADELSVGQCMELISYCVNTSFHCENTKCGNVFKIGEDNEDNSEKIKTLTTFL